MRSWAGEGSDCTSTWEATAIALMVATPSRQPRWLPNFAWQGKSRWACLVREAPTEHHIYAGLCCVNGRPPGSQDVADRCAELVTRLGKVRVKRDDFSVRFHASAELHVRGAQTGRVLRPPPSMWEVVRQPQTLAESVPVIGAAFATGLATSSAADWGLRQYGTIFVVATIMVMALVGLRWASQRSNYSWEATGWPI